MHQVTAHSSQVHPSGNPYINRNNQFYSPSRNQNPNNRQTNPIFYSPNQSHRQSHTSMNPSIQNQRPQFTSDPNINSSNYRDIGYKFGEPIRSKENYNNRPSIFNEDNPNGNYNVPLKKSDFLIPDAVRGSMFKHVVTERERVDQTMKSQKVLTNRTNSTSNSLRDSKYMHKNFGMKASYHQE